MRRFACTIAVLAMVLSIFGCTAQDVRDGAGLVTDSAPEKAVLVGDLVPPFPLVSEPASMNILITGHAGADQEQVYVWQQYEKMTGVDVKWTTVTREDRAEAVNTVLMNGQRVDLILRCKISASRLSQYGESGLLIDLAKDGLLETYAPNCWAYLQKNPDTLASVMTPDGAIYALPQVNSGAELRVSRKLFINKAWLENVQMHVPATTEELYALLLAFKEQDANGNGDPNDEIPLCSIDFASIQEALFGAFGLGNRGLHSPTVDCNEETGKVRFIAASDSYLDYLSYLRRLYEKGLLDNSIFTVTQTQWYSNVENDLVGVFSSTNLASLPADKADNWIAVEDALEGPNGDRLWTAIRANFHSTGAAAIPATCKDPALALRWLDYFWTDEGTLFYHMGVEGETFVSGKDGSYDYMPYIYEEMTAENKTFDDVIAAYSPYPGGSNPTVEVAPYFMGGEMAPVPAQAARKLFAYGPEEYWPGFTFTAEENDTLNAIRADIEKYCSTARVEFVTGVRDLSEWDAYLEQLNDLRLPEMLALYQSAVDRYHAMDHVGA